jgi:hypothetical protein
MGENRDRDYRRPSGIATSCITNTDFGRRPALLRILAIRTAVAAEAP